MTRPKPPLPVQFVLAFAAAAVLIAAMIIFVDNNQNDPNENRVNPSAIAEANREADIVVGQDQAPHVVAFTGTPTRARSALIAAVREYMNGQINLGTITGPLAGVTCRPGGERAYLCSALAAGVSYPFVGVADLSRHQLVYCKKDAAPVAGETIPLSPRCTGTRD